MAETVLREFLREESAAEPDILLPNDPSPASRRAAIRSKPSLS